MKTRTCHHNASEVDWYCELRGGGPSDLDDAAIGRSLG
jgi:hypothetical protein